MKQNILPVNDVCLYQITHSLTVDVEKKTCISLNLFFNVLTLVDMQLFVVIKSFFFFFK